MYSHTLHLYVAYLCNFNYIRVCVYTLGVIFV